MERKQWTVKVNRDLAIDLIRKKSLLLIKFVHKAFEGSSPELCRRNEIRIQCNADAVMLCFSTLRHQVETASICHKRLLGNKMQALPLARNVLD